MFFAICCSKNYYKTIKLFEKEKKYSQSFKNNCLKNVCKRGYYNIVKYLISIDAKVTDCDRNALVLSVVFNYPEIESLLIENGAKFSRKDADLIFDQLDMNDDPNIKIQLLSVCASLNH